jgi:hypothetical protein
MKITELKNIMKQINEPNEFVAKPVGFEHPLYWIYIIDGVRIKTLFNRLTEFRPFRKRFDVFINGLLIDEADYIIQNNGNSFYIKFIKEKFPEFDRFGNIYELEDSDEVKVEGDLEEF